MKKGAAASVILFGSFLFLALFGTAQAAVPCHQLMADSRVPQQYGAPFNVHAQSRELLITATCDETAASLTVGTGNRQQYIYHLAYAWHEGGWSRVELQSNDRANDDWIIGLAQAKLSRQREQMRQKNFVVAYVCTWIPEPAGQGGQWKCGCRDSACKKSHWQLQTFAYEPPPELSEDALPQPADAPDAEIEGVLVSFPSQYFGPHGSELALSGYGFEQSGNNAHFVNLEEEEFVVSGTTLQGGKVVVVVPESVPIGKYKVLISNSRGISEHGPLFVVTPPNVTPPELASVTPESGRPGMEVVVRGGGFTPEGNDIYMMHSVVRDVSSPDGTTLTFTVPRPFEEEFQDASGRAIPQEISDAWRVVNNHGVSPQALNFALSY